MSARHLKVLAGVAVSGAAIWLLLSGLSIERLLDVVSRLSIAGLAGALAFLALGYALRVVRWWWMLRAFAPAIRLRDCAMPLLGSVALNNVLPLRAGDAIRAFGFRRQLGLPASTVLGTVVVERLLDLSMLLAFFFAGAALAPASALPPGATRAAAAVAVVAILMLGLLPLAGPRLARRLAHRAAPDGGAPTGLGAARAGAARLLESFALLRSVRHAAPLLPLTVLVWGFEGAVFATVAHDLASDAPIAGAWFALATGTLATLLPSTPGYVGTFDYFAMLGFVAFGAEREVATALSLSVHAVLWAPVTAVGLSLLALRGGRAAFAPSSPDATRPTDHAMRTPT